MTGDDRKSGGPKQIGKTLIASSEGRILLAGAAIAFLYIFWMAFRLLARPHEAQVLVGMTAIEVLFGRAAAMAYGYSMDMSQWFVMIICMVLETILVLIFYPLFVFSWTHLLVFKWLRKTFDRIRQSAETHKAKIHKYGIAGLFLFVWFPFWMTGPVVGCVIGFMLGLPAWLNLSVVLCGTYTAILGWGLFLKHLSSYNSYTALVLLIILIVLVVIGHLLHRTIQESKSRNNRHYED